MRIKEIIGTRSIASTGRRAFAPSIEYAPSIRDGLLWVAPLRDNAQSLYDNGIVAYIDPSTQAIDADGTYIDSYGIMQDAILDVLRIEGKGALIEETRTNLFLQSQAIPTSWSINASRSTFTANSAVAPDGTTTATKHAEKAVGGVKYALQIVPATDTVQYCASIYVKQFGSDLRDIQMIVDDTAAPTATTQFFALDPSDVGIGTSGAGIDAVAMEILEDG